MVRPRSFLCTRDCGRNLVFGEYVNSRKNGISCQVEIISTVMNFLCIVQVELSFMFAHLTSNACSVNRNGRKVFPICGN